MFEAAENAQRDRFTLSVFKIGNKIAVGVNRFNLLNTGKSYNIVHTLFVHYHIAIISNDENISSRFSRNSNIYILHVVRS